MTIPTIKDLADLAHHVGAAHATIESISHRVYEDGPGVRVERRDDGNRLHLVWAVGNGKQTGESFVTLPFPATLWDYELRQAEEAYTHTWIENKIIGDDEAALLHAIMGDALYYKYRSYDNGRVADVLYLTEVWWNKNGVVACPYTKANMHSLGHALHEAEYPWDAYDGRFARAKTVPAYMDTLPHDASGFDEDWQKDLYVDLVNEWDLRGDGRKRVGSHTMDAFNYTTELTRREWEGFGWELEYYDLGRFSLPVTELFEYMLQTEMSGRVDLHTGMQALWEEVEAVEMPRIDQFLDQLDHYWKLLVIDTGGRKFEDVFVGTWHAGAGGGRLAGMDQFSSLVYIGHMQVGSDRQWDQVTILDVNDRVLFLATDDPLTEELRQVHCKNGCWCGGDWSTHSGDLEAGIEVAFGARELTDHPWNYQETMPGFDPVRKTGPQLDGSFVIKLNGKYHCLPDTWKEDFAVEEIEHPSFNEYTDTHEGNYPLIVIQEPLVVPLPADSLGEADRTYVRIPLCPVCFEAGFSVGGPTIDIMLEGI